MAGGKPTRTTGARGRRGAEAARQYSSLPPSARTLGDIRSRVVLLERVSKLVVWVWSVGAGHGLGGRGVS